MLITPTHPAKVRAFPKGLVLTASPRGRPSDSVKTSRTMSTAQPVTVDLRSDVLSKAPPEMIEAMGKADWGDDVYKECTTIIALQNKVADLLQKEAALFVPSGTMGNLISVLSHCQRRGAEAIMLDNCHIYLKEQGGISQIGSVHPRLLRNRPDGTFSLDEMEKAVNNYDQHNAETSLVCIENTHGAGGVPLPLEWLQELGKRCQKLGLPLHMDGARLLNAAVALNVPPSQIVEGVTSVSLCFSKGLGAPCGSIIVGPKDFIERATRLRKVLGGAMRQPGMLAAAALYALKHYPTTLGRNHAHAKIIAKAIADAKNDGMVIDPPNVQTNIVCLKVLDPKLDAKDMANRLATVTENEEKELGERIVIRAFSNGENKVRFVTHSSLSSEDIAKAAKKITYVLSEASSQGA